METLLAELWDQKENSHIFGLSSDNDVSASPASYRRNALEPRRVDSQSRRLPSYLGFSGNLNPMYVPELRPISPSSDVSKFGIASSR